MTRQAAFADLGVVGDDQADQCDIIRSLPLGDLVIQAGRPVLHIPASGMTLEPSTVVIAWKNTREARRAVVDAVPFLHRAETVVAYSVLEGSDDHRPARTSTTSSLISRPAALRPPA